MAGRGLGPTIRMIRAAGWVVAAFTVLVVLLLALGLHAATSMPAQRRATVPLADWPSGVSPLKIALISDIHLGSAGMSSARLETIIRDVNAARPDLILLAGDFVNGHAPLASGVVEALAAPLAGARARYGVVAVLGNHDHWTNPEDVAAALRRAGVIVLDNGAIQAGAVTVVGVSDAFSGHDDVRRAFAAAEGLVGPAIVFSHSPDVARDLPAGASLLLAGHTHCGQVVLPFVGSLAGRSPREGMKPLYDPDYRCGLIRDGARTVIVTAGVGPGSLPIRIGAPPDWWLLEVGPSPVN